jgi:hypothetical protein
LTHRLARSILNFTDGENRSNLHVYALSLLRDAGVYLERSLKLPSSFTPTRRKSAEVGF